MKIRWIWKQQKENRDHVASAGREVEESRRRYDAATRKMAILESLHGQNHFAEILAESLVKGHSKK